MKKHAFIFIGRSGSGKGTQIEFLQEKIKEKFTGQEILTFITGDGLREIASGDTYTAKLTNDILDKGELLPSFLTASVLGDLFIEEMKEDTILFVDGFTRKVIQSGIIDSAISFYGYDNTFIVDVQISEEESFKRLLARGREDDSNEAIEKRMKWYKENTIPAIDFFRNKEKYKVLDINGEQSREQVRDDIWRALDLE